MFGKSRWTLQVAGRQNFTCRFIIVTDMRATVIFLSSSRQEDKKPFSSLQVNQNYFRLQQRHVSSGTNEPVISCQMFDSWAASLILWDLSKYYYQYYSVIIVVPLFDSAEGFQEYDVQQKVSFLELKHWSCSYQPEHLLGKCLTNFYGNWVVNIIKSRDESGSSDEHDDDAQIYIRSYSLQMGPCQEQMYISANHGFAKTYKYIKYTQVFVVKIFAYCLVKFRYKTHSLAGNTQFCSHKHGWKMSWCLVKNIQWFHDHSFSLLTLKSDQTHLIWMWHDTYCRGV